jgi:hypothetical protein
MIFLILILYAVACYVFLFINSGLKLLNRKLTKEEPVWAFKDAVRSWGFDDEDYVVTTRRSYLSDESFSWGFFAFMFVVSPFWFLWEFSKLLTRLVITPILHFLGEN